MTTIGLCMAGSVARVGPSAEGRGRGAPETHSCTHGEAEYTLRDERGTRLGRIVSPVNRPETGRHAPTYYLRRDV